MIVEHREHYDLMIGESSRSIFDFFSIEAMHGLSLDECIRHPEPSTPGTPGVYIHGWANLRPDNGFPFLFLNSFRMVGDYRDALAIMHETMHIAWLMFDLEKEEEKAISWAELEAEWIYQNYFLKSNPAEWF